MSRQMFLHELLVDKGELEEKASKEISILNWNIRNPSLQRAKAQCDWILASGANIIALTEAKYSDGCRFIRDWLQSYGFMVRLPVPEKDDYCVMIGARGVPCQAYVMGATFLPYRLLGIFMTTTFGRLRVVCVYVPSRGPVERRNKDKRQFQNQVTRILPQLTVNADEGELVVCGDLNVVERNHVPRYSIFGEWEYAFYDSFQNAGLVDAFRLKHQNVSEHSWFGREGDGYRFDHIFASRGLCNVLSECYYDHTPHNRGLSDHSAMILTMHARGSGAMRDDIPNSEEWNPS